MKSTYDYSSVYLVPKVSSINSREDVDLSIQLSKTFKLDVPIIASPMLGITSPAIVSGLSELGGIGIIHRFQALVDIRRSVKTILKTTSNFGVAVGSNGDGFETAKEMLDYGAKIICIDVANGYLEKVRGSCNRLSNYISSHNYDCLLMSGNVVTRIGAEGLYASGVDLIRVGIGNGTLCSTRTVTGVGVGQLTALQNCSEMKWPGMKIVADGGIHNSGDAVKALAAGADVLLIGSLFGKCYESEHKGIIAGMASRRIQDEYYHGKYKSIEGIEKEIVKDVSLDDFISDFTWGMKSAFTYVGAHNIQELKDNVEFCIIQ